MGSECGLVMMCHAYIIWGQLDPIKSKSQYVLHSFVLIHVVLVFKYYTYIRPRLSHMWTPAVNEDNQQHRIDHHLAYVSRTSRRLLQCISRRTADPVSCSLFIEKKGLRLTSLTAHKIQFWGVRLGEGAQARVRYLNTTKQEVSTLTNICFMFLGPSAFNKASWRVGVPLWTAAWTLQ